MHIAILGRQHYLGLAELERVASDVTPLSTQAALTSSPLDVTRLGGSLKTGEVVLQLPRGDWRTVQDALLDHYIAAWQSREGKITLGISAYGLRTSPRDIQHTGITLKKRLKSHNVSLRLIPNNELALNTATSHHNKLGLSPSKVELLIVRANDGSITIAESTGAQNITALARRDQGRPKRDAFVGMLPPKLAQIIINLAAGDTRRGTVLDPFCGTGVLLQEAMLLGYDAYGTDLADKMIDFTQINLEWAQQRLHATTTFRTHQGDAMSTTWQQPIDIIACESYLGQPFSAPPSPSKLREVRGNCNHIIGTFLRNVAKQLPAGTPLCIAVPAWQAKDGSFTHLPLVSEPELFGFTRIPLKHTPARELLYYRDNQVVARELLLIEKT